MIENNYKGTGAVFVRSFVRSRGPEVEQRLLASLTPQETAPLLFPSDKGFGAETHEQLSAS